MNKNCFGIARTVVAVSVLFVAANGCNQAAKPPTGTEGGSTAESVVRVSVSKPSRKILVAKTTQPARIEAFEQTPLFSKVSGYVEEVHADIGDKVTKDQPLVTLRVPELADDVRQKAALVAQAAAQLKQAEANVTAANAAAETATAKIAEANSGVTRTSAEYERWKSEYERVKALAANGSVTQKLSDETLNQFHAAEAAREAADAAVQTAEAGAREAQANAVKAEADRLEAEAYVAVANAEAAHAKTMLDYATIRAPYDGVVTKRSVDTGHFVQPAGVSAGPLMAVARTDKVRVYIEVPELEAAGVDVGDKASIHLQAMPTSDIESAVTRTSWSLDPANRSLRTEIDLPNDGAKLRPGMYATGTIETVRHENAMVLPVAAVYYKDGKPHISCVDGGRVEIKPVRVGLRVGSEIEIASGADDSSLVVVAQGDKLSQGQAVEPNQKM